MLMLIPVRIPHHKAVNHIFDCAYNKALYKLSIGLSLVSQNIVLNNDAQRKVQL